MVAFINTKYEGDNGDIHGILLHPDKAAVAGTAPTGTVSSPVKVKISKTNKEYGIRPRGVKLVRILGTAPDTFKKYAFLPVLTSTAFGTGTFAIGSEITVGSVSWTVTSKQGEDY
jgi:hypothetical protein